MYIYIDIYEIYFLLDFWISNDVDEYILAVVARRYDRLLRATSRFKAPNYRNIFVFSKKV